jgi:hypothetical protein
LQTPTVTNVPTRTDSFADQPATLAMQPTIVLFGDARRAHNAPDLRLTTQIRQQ